MYILNYFKIIKPGIIAGNLFSLIGGFFLASKDQINWKVLFFSLSGSFFIIASACVFNNIFDVDLDKKMKRTKDRVLVKGLLSKKIVFIYGTLLGGLGLLITYYFLNNICIFLSIFAFLMYVVFYTLLSKRYTVYSTFIGTISGAIPPVIGYCSVTNHLDLCSIIIYVSLIFWQVPHFYSISLNHFLDYKKSNIPILPIYSSIKSTKFFIILFITFYIITNSMLSFFLKEGSRFLITSFIFSFLWLFLAIYGYFRSVNITIWAKYLFIFSLLTIVVNTTLIITDRI